MPETSAAQGGADRTSYVVGPRVAVGGMAELFAAWRRDGTGPPLLIKRLLPDGAADPEVVRALVHEGQLMQRLAHPNLVAVLEVRREGEAAELVLERVDGASLAAVLEAMRREGAEATEAMALAVALPVLDALIHVHEARDEEGAPLSIVHRDVTPQNMLLSRDADVRLGDFGIARSSLRDSRTRTGVIKGKLRYLAPEQVTGSDVDARTDLYALALTLFELVAHEPYLEAETDAQLLRAAEEPEFRGASERFDSVLRRALSRFPEGRPRSARVMRDALLELTDEAERARGRAEWAPWVAKVAPPPEALQPPRQPEAPPAPRSWARRASVAVALGLAGVAASWGVTQLEREPPAASSPGPVESPVLADEVEVEPLALAAPPVEAPTDAPPEPEAAEPSPPARRAPRPPRAPTPPDPAPPEPAPEADPTLERVRAEVTAARASLRSRGVAPGDLSPAQRRALTTVRSALEARDAPTAVETWTLLRAELAAIAVDEPFVRAKLARVDAAIRAARERGDDTSAIERLSAIALQDLLARRYGATNERLNEILSRL